MTKGGYFYINGRHEWGMPVCIRISCIKNERQSRQRQSESGKAYDQRAPKNRLQGIDLFRQFLDEFELLSQPLLHFRNACLEWFFPCLGLCLLIFEGRNGGDNVGDAGGDQLKQNLGNGPRSRHDFDCSLPPEKREAVFISLSGEPSGARLFPFPRFRPIVNPKVDPGSGCTGAPV